MQRATLVGHSLGGGVALQFAWLFPERVERLVLVSSGGLGRELSHSLSAGADIHGQHIVTTEAAATAECASTAVATCRVFRRADCWTACGLRPDR